MSRWILAASLLLAPGLVHAQDPEKKTDEAEKKPEGKKPHKASVAVLKFSYVDTVLKTDDGWTKRYLTEFDTSLLTSKFITALVKTNKFDVVDRDKIEQVLKEQQFGETGQLDPERCVKAGKIIGADFMLTGAISYFVIVHKSLENPYARGNYTHTVSAEIVVDARIVNTRTTKIVASDKGEAKVSTKFQSSSTEVSVTPKLLDDVQRELCEKLAVKTIDSIFPVKVSLWKDGVAYLNRGEGGGLTAGEVFDVFEVGEDVIDPDTGAVIGTTDKLVGQLKVTSVEAKLSKAEPVGSLASVPKGAICKKAKPAPVEQPADPKQPGGW